MKNTHDRWNARKGRWIGGRLYRTATVNDPVTGVKETVFKLAVEGGLPLILTGGNKAEAEADASARGWLKRVGG